MKGGLSQRFFTMVLSIGGSREACPVHAPPPLRDQILSFSHTFLLKSTHVGGPHPPMGPRPPPTGNPGSATVLSMHIWCSIQEVHASWYLK